MTQENGRNGGRTIGYARVSTSDQDLRLQLDALKKHGVPKDMIFTDKASGSKEDRRGLEACLAELHEGDVLLVWRLDRLGRSIRHLVSLIDELKQRGVGFRSICDGAIDTTSASGELIFHVFSALAHFERRLIAERTKAGLVAARARGRSGGRPKLDPHDPRIATTKTLHRDRSLSGLEDILERAMTHLPPNKCAVANRRPAGQSEGSGNLFAAVAASPCEP